MVVTPEFKYVLCSWCGYGTFYPLEESVLLCTCAGCGSLKTIEDRAEQTIETVDLE